ncbi:hypothetical protein BDW59DRAFT_160889 [Aspergillus cavernicola]|uniref:G domain-containing protein n=1 Tax=Aspergillus cavernicola TaxID=176166 RepID=A0ABR4IG26_9EURO
MDILNATLQQLTDQAQRLSAVTGIVKHSSHDRFFLVLGKTGSGKSTFVARCTGKDVKIGHGLYSCTLSIDTYSYTVPNPHNRHASRRIHLIDCPGFNDTNRSDIETLGILASYLGASYANSVRIDGIIMLHPITDNRIGGSSMRNINMMKKMCGWASYENLAVATMMWPQAGVHDMAALEQREAELFTDQRFLGDLVTKGAAIFRHNESGRRDVNEETSSARRIIAHLIAKSDTNSTPKVLRLQREIIDEGKTLGETAAGIAVARDLYAARKEHERQLRDLETELKAKMVKAEEEKKALQVSMQEMHEKEEKAWMEKIEALDQQFCAKIAQKEEELEELGESIREIRQDAMISRQSVESEKEFAEHEEIISNTRREVVEARDAHGKLKAQAGNIANGAANGIAAGIATSVMTGVLAGTFLCTVM